LTERLPIRSNQPVDADTNGAVQARKLNLVDHPGFGEVHDFDPAAGWPRVEPLADYQARARLHTVAACGTWESNRHRTAACNGITRDPFEVPEAAAALSRLVDDLAAHGW
jgi:hypothetical protein